MSELGFGDGGSWFDLVVVLRCDNTLLWDRLAARCDAATSMLCMDSLWPWFASVPRLDTCWAEAAGVWSRGYTETKVKENVECEIMQVLLEEARESYK
jgi:predicted RNase H-like HicB family nuclease